MTHVDDFLKKPGVIVSAGWLVSQEHADLFMIILYMVTDHRLLRSILTLNYLIKLKSGIETT